MSSRGARSRTSKTRKASRSPSPAASPQTKRAKTAANGSSSSPAPKKGGRKAATAAAEDVVIANGSSETKTFVRQTEDGLVYMHGLSAEHQSEALPGAVPKQNTPQRCPYDLIAEQISGTSFTTPRVNNRRSWFYRILPTCVHKPFKPVDKGLIQSDFTKGIINPNQMRWAPFPLPKEDEKLDFIDGLATLCGAGSPESKTGIAIHIYRCTQSMTHRSFVNADGDMLFVPQHGVLTIRTEFGRMRVAPGEIAVVQRGMKFSVLVDGPSRGYVCEVYDGHFQLPELGPIGSNGLAHPRDFQVPVAEYERIKGEFTMTQKFLGELFEAEMDHSPFDVVGWHGNYFPFKYDLSKYNTVNSVSYDHLDPSIFTVITCPTALPGVAALDFVIFPPRWAVQEKTFRPPYYHRNCMSEFMGNIYGQYDAKPEGFLPGGGSLHSAMVGHGPDGNSFKKAVKADLKPVKMDDALAFMFESTYIFRLTEWGAKSPLLEKDYYKCWEDVPADFNPSKP